MAINVIKDYIKDKKQSKVVMPYTLDECVQSADGTKHLSLADIDNLKGDITHQAQRITNLENASKGILYDTVTDSTEAYVKSIQSGAVSGYGMLDSVGGKALVQSNQIVDVTVDKAIVHGTNIWNEEWELGDLSNTGQEASNNNMIRNKGYIDIEPNTAYFFYSDLSGVNDLFFYDANKNFISLYRSTNIKNKTFTTPENAKYMRFYNTTIKTYTSGISIYLGTESKGYIKYATTEITLPTTTLKGINSSVYDIADFENGKIVRKVGSRAYQSGDESNPNYLTDMTTTYYPLATPTEETLTTDEIIFPIEPNGTITFNNAYGVSVPNSITYNIHTTS